MSIRRNSSFIATVLRRDPPHEHFGGGVGQQQSSNEARFIAAVSVGPCLYALEPLGRRDRGERLDGLQRNWNSGRSSDSGPLSRR